MKIEILERLIDSLLEKRLQNVACFTTDEKSFNGYKPLEVIRGQLLQWVAVPFNKVPVWCQLRCPNAIQLEQCGNISNIVIDNDTNKKWSYDEMITIRNYQEELCKITFNIPTYDNLAQLVGDYDFVLSEKKKELEILEKKYDDNVADMTEVQRETLRTRIRTIQLQIGYIIPDDTMVFITKWAMGHDVSDIKKITKENLLRAATLARVHHKAPTDYISGRFTDYNKQEIDSYAQIILDEHIQEHKVVQDSKFQWFLGGRKRYSDTSLLPKQPGGK